MTTSLIDAGTGVGDMTLAEMAVFATSLSALASRSHRRHPADVDSIFSQISEPVGIHASAADHRRIAQSHLNWTIWPDFTVLPTAASGVCATK